LSCHRYFYVDGNEPNPFSGNLYATEFQDLGLGNFNIATLSFHLGNMKRLVAIDFKITICIVIHGLGMPPA
jgi:hypothetical protein